MGLSTILMFVVMLGLIFFMQRQQKKQAQERQNQLNAIQKGDEVVTIGGMYAIVDEVDTVGNKIVLDVDGVFLPFELSAIKRVVSKGDHYPEAAVVTESETVVEPESEVVEESAIDSHDSNDSAIESH
ncbi:preprotein translocase subunit YajC [Streptococcus uberis]|uniref:preprotein translocase subunit YajC n=1 Tax=Streptococcus uberis TaxID=1349 RepID=UPI001320E6DA|nr:preprotein translocase subunit YajC [Streptococcus uberis]MWV52271.1 preprotein translocase subunit YajC [Streptococcus uberis]